MLEFSGLLTNVRIQCGALLTNVRIQCGVLLTDVRIQCGALLTDVRLLEYGVLPKARRRSKPSESPAHNHINAETS